MPFVTPVIKHALIDTIALLATIVKSLLSQTHRYEYLLGECNGVPGLDKHTIPGTHYTYFTHPSLPDCPIFSCNIVKAALDYKIVDQAGANYIFELVSHQTKSKHQDTVVLGTTKYARYLWTP